MNETNKDIDHAVKILKKIKFDEFISERDKAITIPMAVQALRYRKRMKPKITPNRYCPELKNYLCPTCNNALIRLKIIDGRMKYVCSYGENACTVCGQLICWEGI